MEPVAERKAMRTERDAMRPGNVVPFPILPASLVLPKRLPNNTTPIPQPTGTEELSGCEGGDLSPRTEPSARPEPH